MKSLLTIIFLSVLANSVTSFEGQFSEYYRNLDRQMPIVNVQRRVDGNMVYGSVNEVTNTGNDLPKPPQLNIPGAVAAPSDALLESIGSLEAENKMEEQELIDEDPGLLDSFLGDGVQSRIVTSLNNWIVDKARTNPGCVERFVCETYRTGETLNGIPYLAMSMTNAAVSFMVADMFDRSIDAGAITKAARHGRTIGSCHTMQCDFVDGQLRDLGDYLETIEEFFSSIFSSVSNSLTIGKK
jgi:hypothetical protein